MSAVSTQQQKILEEIRSRKGTFQVKPVEGKGKFLKRLGRKLTFWYVEPFGKEQNEFNSLTADALDSLSAEIAAEAARAQERVAALERQTKAETARLLGELQRQKEMYERRIEALRKSVDRGFAAAAPEGREGAGQSPLCAIETPDVIRLRGLEQVRNASGANAREALENLGREYTALLQREIDTRRRKPENRAIAFVCKEYARGEGMEAIRNELRALFDIVKAGCVNPVLVLSIEPEGSTERTDGDFHFVPEEKLEGWLSREDPVLLVFCESTPAILNTAKQCMLLRDSVIRLTAQNPLQGIGGSMLQELLHLCDHGVQHYLVASEAAADCMEEMGFRRPAVMYPVIDRDDPKLLRRSFAQKARFTVGFASSPLQEKQSRSRGVDTLGEVIAQNPEISFVVLWRDSATPCPEGFVSPNCEVRYGFCDMGEFYGEIDALVIPYSDENYNHACPLSAVEAMLLGIPVVSTPCSGVTELLARTGLGETAAGTDAGAISKALRTVRENPSRYGQEWQGERLRRILSRFPFVSYVRECIEGAPPHGICTLYEWDRRLKTRQKHLIKGHAALRAYYQREEIAEHYTADRFESWPQNAFDLMERQSVAVLARTLTGKITGTREILDLACGDGRILSALLELGNCTAADASDAMLGRVRERFDGKEFQTVKLDLLEDDLPGQYDVITIFRFLRHYEYRVRAKLWAKLREALRGRGVVLFDVPNRRFEIPQRRRTGWENYHIYDVFWSVSDLRAELSDNGLELCALVPIGQGLYSEAGDEPMTWTAAARRKE